MLWMCLFCVCPPEESTQRYLSAWNLSPHPNHKPLPINRCSSKYSNRESKTFGGKTASWRLPNVKHREQIRYHWKWLAFTWCHSLRVLRSICLGVFLKRGEGMEQFWKPGRVDVWNKFFHGNLHLLKKQNKLLFREGRTEQTASIVGLHVAHKVPTHLLHPYTHGTFW